MAGRLLNGGIENVGGQSLLSLPEEVASTEQADPDSAWWTMHFVDYQRGKNGQRFTAMDVYFKRQSRID